MRITADAGPSNRLPSCTWSLRTESHKAACRRTKVERKAIRRCCRCSLPSQRTAGTRGPSCDLVLSSGFLAFAIHAGFLQAVDQADLQIEGIMGTSSGALAGSLYAAGYTPDQIAYELCHLPPIQRLRLSLRPWRGGIFSLHKVVERLHELLPATFEELPTRFACGVVSWQGRYQLLDKGSLAEAVAASIAVPFLFTAVDIQGQSGGPFKDGGVADRVGLEMWRNRRRQELPEDCVPRAAVHLVSRSSPFSGTDDVRGSGEAGVSVFRSPRSRKTLLSMGDWQSQMSASHQYSAEALQRWQQQQKRKGQPA
ncbi:hypothetical protein WJX73_004204 [Symbiochloris irregularis]|uniref:Patatin n=1 Tax=Symbiochloris irregularis TaxID=706552 RepID=A0AAW1NXA4_9CHLO